MTIGSDTGSDVPKSEVPGPTKTIESATSGRIDRSPFVFTIAVLIFVMRVVGPLWRAGMPSFFPDSASFLKVARIGPVSADFWFTERPVGMPLVFWLVGFDVRWLAVVQSTAYAAAAAFLCATLLRVLSSRWLAWAASALVASIAAQPRFALWCVEALSESLGLTTSVIALAFWIAFANHPSRRMLTISSVATAAWALTRDSHGLPLMVVVIALALGAWRSTEPAMRRTALRCTLALMMTFAYVVVSQGVSNRNQYPLMNNVGLRILPDSSMTESFVDKGMPMSDSLLDRTGRNTWDDGEVFLNSPDLESFRDWANGTGQFDQLTSLLTDAPFWIDVTQRELRGAITYDFADYDRFDVADRLPNGLLGFSGLDSPNQAWFAVVVAIIALAAIHRSGRRRMLALILGTGLIATLVELYASAATDAVEVQRHLVGPLFRLHLILLVIVAVAIDERLSRNRDKRPRPIMVRDSWFPTTLASGIVLSLIALFAIETRSQDFDPQYARTIIERAARFGGTYYENGIHNKGPIETFVYDSVRLFTSYSTYWFGIATYVILISAVLAVAAATMNRVFGGHRTSMLLVGLITAVHFTLSSSDYAGVVYSRNLTTCMLALVVIITMSDRFWLHDGRSRRAWVLSFVILGLAIQTLLTTVFAAAGLVVALVMLRRRESGHRRPVLVGMGTFVATVLAAPAWYLMRGGFAEFWSGWWTYASFMSKGTGRGFMEQFGLGWNTMVDYYGERPESVIVVVGFVLFAWLRWNSMSTRQRLATAAIGAWFVGGWIELALGQRFSSHYFSVIAVPTALMLAMIISSISNALVSVGRWTGESRKTHDRRAVHAPVLAALTLVLVTQCSTLFWDGTSRAGAFTSFSRLEQSRDAAQDGQSRTVRAILDLVSDDGDAVLAWTMYPWTYLNNERVPATRLSWKSFMLGEIYLGRTSTDYVLPDTWEWFADDMRESNPAAYLRPTETLLDTSTPFAEFVAREFVPAYGSSAMEVQIRSSIWSRLLQPTSTDAPRTAPFVDESGCFRWQATVSGLDATEPFGFTFEDPDGSAETVHLSIDSERAWSSSDNVEFASSTRSSGGSTTSNAAITLLVGPRSALLVEDGVVLAGVRLDGTVRTSVFSAEGIEVTDGTRSPLSGVPGCVGR